MVLKNRLALVTGAGRGIGRAITLTLADAGADVIVNDIHTADATEVVGAVRRKNRRAVVCSADVRDHEAIAQSFRAAASAMGRSIDVLINNAGIGDFVDFSSISPEKWALMIDTHLTGTFNCCKALLPSMINVGWGKILNVSSVAGKRGDFIGNAHYTAAKAGIIGFTRSLAAYAAPHGVNVNAIAPGIVDTALTREMSIEHRAATLSRIPIGRFATAEEIASAALFLVSDAARYVVGETLNVNGGSYMD